MNEELSVRLRTVVEMAGTDIVRLIDVGSDHGKLAVSVLFENRAGYVVCTDIHKDPAQRTEQNIRDHLLSERAEVYCTDGLKGIELKAGDVIVMAGLGGNNIIDILREAVSVTPEQVLRQIRLVLQPQKSIDRLRRYLASEGFTIDNEAVCIDRDIFYQMMSVSYSGIPYDISLEEAFYGPVLLGRARKGDELVLAFHKHLDDINRIRARGDAEIMAVAVRRGIL